VTYRRGLYWIVGFIDTLFTQVGTTGNYSDIADLHTLQFIVTNLLELSVFASRILATDLQVSLLLRIIHEVFFAPSNSILAIVLLSSSYLDRLASRNTVPFDAVTTKSKSHCD
jgi:hypothetical protein